MTAEGAKPGAISFPFGTIGSGEVSTSAADTLEPPACTAEAIVKLNPVLTRRVLLLGVLDEKIWLSDELSSTE